MVPVVVNFSLGRLICNVVTARNLCYFFFVCVFSFARALVFSVHTFLCGFLVNCFLTFVLVC